jgi:hypothetical protein
MVEVVVAVRAWERIHRWGKWRASE